MTKANLIAKIADKTDLTKADSERALNACLESIQDILMKDGKLTLTGFGTFSVDQRQERKGRNPQTGAPITIPAAKVVKFRPGKLLKESVK
jgi:DNA-binding protein HU-beta